MDFNIANKKNIKKYARGVYDKLCVRSAILENKLFINHMLIHTNWPHFSWPKFGKFGPNKYVPCCTQHLNVMTDNIMSDSHLGENIN